MKFKNKMPRLTEAALIAAVYVLLTLIGAPLASGVIQVRFAEALSILPYFTPAAVPGLFAGCVLANIVTGCAPWDVVFGSLATLIGAIFARLLRKFRYLTPLPAIVANTVIIPFVLRYVYGVPEALPFLFLTVGIGEVISAGVLGIALLAVLQRNRRVIFRSDVAK